MKNRSRGFYWSAYGTQLGAKISSKSVGAPDDSIQDSYYYPHQSEKTKKVRDCKIELSSTYQGTLRLLPPF